MIPKFATKSLLHFTPREVAMINEPTIVVRKKTWSIQFPPKLLAWSEKIGPPSSQSDGVLEARTKTTTVGSHKAALTELCRFDSRSRRQRIKDTQKINATGAIQIG
jgi:hypothetical protein